jgi:hypothetical protein
MPQGQGREDSQEIVSKEGRSGAEQRRKKWCKAKKEGVVESKEGVVHGT